MKRKISSAFLACFVALLAGAQLNRSASEALLKRILPAKASLFAIESLSPAEGKDVFEVESRNGKIVLRGNNGIAVASALYYYLNEYCHCQITWNGTNLKLPATLPKVPSKIRRQTPYEYRYYLNYCTFNYSMSWWDWPRWEKEIDWMALHGINLPLAITGEEYTWYTVYKNMGFSDEDLNGFFCGPAYFAWFWMGNLDGWGGPLPLRWMEAHRDLQQKIVNRYRELGIKPVLPAFTGHVPATFKTKFPQAKLKVTNWKVGFADTYILDSEDPLFAAIGKKFLEAQTQLYGTDHLYSADTFNENEPPSDDPAFLSKLSQRVYEGMKAADPQAVWVMQGWLFYNDRKFWKAPQIEGLLKAVPNDKMIILDLATETEAVWKRTQSFYGKPWIWNLLHNFGGNNTLFGRMETVATDPAAALHDPAAGALKGIGLTMEAIEQNPAIYELMTQNTWTDAAVNLNDWLPAYVRNRYGIADGHAQKAWTILQRTVYTVPTDKYRRDGAESILQGRPTFDSSTRWTNPRLNYNAEDLWPAWDEMIKAAPACASSEGFRYDLIDVSRQVLANHALPLQRKLAAAYAAKDVAAFNRHAAGFLQLITDLDKLLATQKDFMLGPWVSEARRWGATASEKALYEKNAKDLITLWGNESSSLHEYACRQWSGLLNDFYRVRWQRFFAAINSAWKEGKTVDSDAFQKSIAQWEWQWVNERKDYPTTPSGDAIQVAVQMHKKYREKMGE